MITSHDELQARQHGIDDFQSGKNFAECRYAGFRTEDVEKRWFWQLGWLRAQQDQWDSEKRTKETTK